MINKIKPDAERFKKARNVNVITNIKIYLYVFDFSLKNKYPTTHKKHIISTADLPGSVDNKICHAPKGKLYKMSNLPTSKPAISSKIQISKNSLLKIIHVIKTKIRANFNVVNSSIFKCANTKSTDAIK